VMLFALIYGSSIISNLLFFFQAEDGIRAFHVTGVQTCALPICLVGQDGFGIAFGDQPSIIDDVGGLADIQGLADIVIGDQDADRSEERRVGKECRTRWSADLEIKENLTDRKRKSQCKTVRRLVR